jgi:hypothetical protein
MRDAIRRFAGDIAEIERRAKFRALEERRGTEA